MTSQQAWGFLPITALLLSLLSVHTFAEVVKSMSDCDRFLLHQTPPHIPGILEDGKILNQNRYKPICQTYKNQRRFVTLYDVQNKIPVFSAFRFVGSIPGKRPKSFWRVEPQLESETLQNNMVPRDKNKTYNYQAGDIDYRFNESFNKGSWNKMERCTKCVMEKYCINSSGGTEGFVVTGAQPSLNSKLNNRVNIPSTLWSAFCCYSATAKAWIASSHWGDNVQDESKDKYLETKTLEELHHRLKMSNSEFIVFPGTQCPLQTTVTKFYPEMINCHCPPTTSDPLFSLSIAYPPSHLTFIFTLFIYSYHHCLFC
ncbi:endonuclease domain-containing 1 protein-like isoform X2 [Girardinichthys multiradiatus]|uniref:endonuclease domain-containing 1 protein-like isoform X2 n=1 Tax=Girardinichthys multiradiatus TaxID=208333 RepID=UPI001FAC1C46|nr:endonuclease domain-containing 1 protein-like isoform X2 [Girardinichthys multiradiatus]